MSFCGKKVLLIISNYVFHNDTKKTLFWTNSGNYFRWKKDAFEKRIWDCSIWTVLWSPIPPTRKGIDPPTSKEAPGSQGSSPGGVWGGRGALKRTIQHFNCTLIVDMDGEKKVLLSYNHLFSPGQLQTNPLAKDRGKFELLRK
jgi:hypothetical protein